MVDRPHWDPPLYLPDRVRITSKATYNSGLFIADFAKFAHGPSVWPAFWGKHLRFFVRELVLKFDISPAVGYRFNLIPIYEIGH